MCGRDSQPGTIRLPEASACTDRLVRNHEASRNVDVRQEIVGPGDAAGAGDRDGKADAIDDDCGGAWRSRVRHGVARRVRQRRNTNRVSRHQPERQRVGFLPRGPRGDRSQGGDLRGQRHNQPQFGYLHQKSVHHRGRSNSAVTGHHDQELWTLHLHQRRIAPAFPHSAWGRHLQQHPPSLRRRSVQHRARSHEFQLGSG